MNTIKIPEGVKELKISQESGRVVIEFVPEWKEGDFLHSDWGGENITIIYRKRSGNEVYYYASKSNTFRVQFDKGGLWCDDGDFRLATESEKQELLDALKKRGKRWNAEKLCIEDIPKSNTPEQGKLAIFWGRNRKSSYIRLYKGFTCGVHRDNDDIGWDNAIKFESQEQFEEHIKQ